MEQPDHTADAFTYYLEHEAELRSLVAGVLHGVALHRVDELMSDVVLYRLPRLLRDYDPTVGPFRTYSRRSLKWYVYKALQKADVTRAAEQPDYGDDGPGYEHEPDDALDAAAQIDVLRVHLSRDQMRVLQRRYADGLQIEEICRLMGISKTTCYARLNEALGSARRALGVG